MAFGDMLHVKVSTTTDDSTSKNISQQNASSYLFDGNWCYLKRRQIKRNAHTRKLVPVYKDVFSSYTELA